jgi:hypothetical protein
MKKKLLTSYMLLLIVSITNPLGVFAQSQDDMRKAVTNIFAIGEAAKAAKLQKQNAALLKIKETFDVLKNGGSAQEALNNSILAMQEYQKFSTPYLLAAYASLQLNNPLNARRFMVFYDRAARGKESREINKDVPRSFIEQIRNETNSEFSKYKSADIEKLSANEGWLGQSVDLNLDLALRGIFAGSDNIGTNAKEFDLESHLGLNYHKYLWFNKAKTFSTMGTKNFGLDLNAGVDVKLNLLNSGYYPNREQIYFQPGIFLGRWYIAPLRIQANKVNSYNYASSPSNASSNFIQTTTDSDPVYNPPVIPFPEIRYYTHFVSGYSYDYKKTAKPLIGGMDASYIYFKWGDELYYGTTSDKKNVYSGEQGEGLLGVQFVSDGMISIGMYVGYGTLTAKQLALSGTSMKPVNILNDEFFKSGLNIKVRLY